ncbi:MAG: hypothetical protein AAF600_05705 [Bacteroidota bacterium]
MNFYYVDTLYLSISWIGLLVEHRVFNDQLTITMIMKKPTSLEPVDGLKKVDTEIRNIGCEEINMINSSLFPGLH